MSLYEFSKGNQRISNTDETIVLLEVTGGTLGEPMRVARSGVNFRSKGHEYIGIPFGFKLPDDSEGVPSALEITLPNAGSELADELEQLRPTHRIFAKIIIASRKFPDHHFHVYRIPITVASVTGQSLTATASTDLVGRLMACKETFTPHNAPGLY